MESCSREEETDNGGLRKNAVILCRGGNADSAPLLKPEKPARSGFIIDSAIGDEYPASNFKEQQLMNSLF